MIPSSTVLWRRFANGQLEVQYIPEPMIGEAAARHISLTYRQINKFFDLQRLYEFVSDSILSRTLSSRERGEFASIVYLLLVFERAFDQISKCEITYFQQSNSSV